jgi:ferredoxin
MKIASSPRVIALMAANACLVHCSHYGAAFVRHGAITRRQVTQSSTRFDMRLQATKQRPQRLEENAPGTLYVNDHCINCAACGMFAPSVFGRASRADAHIVHSQPLDAALTAEQQEVIVQQARSALTACPVSAIRMETLAERKHRAGSDEVVWTDSDSAQVSRMTKTKPDKAVFPRAFLDDNSLDVYWVGHHSEDTFGATPYLVRGKHGPDTIWIMVDTPRFSKAAVEAVTSLTGPRGPDYHFLTHVDDVSV